MNPEELKQALNGINFIEAIRVAATDLASSENFAPFEGLITEGKALVLITRDGGNNLHFTTPQTEAISPTPTVQNTPLVDEGTPVRVITRKPKVTA